jgi:hypothetical protein
MENNDLTRRTFLRGFAALSSAVLLMGITGGCGSDGGGGTPVYGAKALYGPPPVPVGTTIVSGMYYLDAGSNRVNLHDSTGVPVGARFEVVFSADMTMISVYLGFVQNSNPIAYDINWLDGHTAQIIPKAPLQANTKYTLLVTSGKDNSGKALAKTDSATFTTEADNPIHIAS